MLSPNKLLNFPARIFLNVFDRTGVIEIGLQFPISEEEDSYGTGTTPANLPTCRKITPSNQVPKTYSQLRCQLLSHLFIRKWKPSVRIIPTIMIQIRKQTTNKAGLESNRKEYWKRVTRVQLLKTISTVFGVKGAENHEVFLLLTRSAYFFCLPKVANQMLQRSSF